MRRHLKAMRVFLQYSLCLLIISTGLSIFMHYSDSQGDRSYQLLNSKGDFTIQFQ